MLCLSRQKNDLIYDQLLNWHIIVLNNPLKSEYKFSILLLEKQINLLSLKACLHGGRVTLSGGLP